MHFFLEKKIINLLASGFPRHPSCTNTVTYLIIADRQYSNVLHLVTRVCVRSGSTCGISPSGNVSGSEEGSACDDLAETVKINIRNAVAHKNVPPVKQSDHLKIKRRGHFKQTVTSE